ncbi:MAG: acyl-CoA dehydrogenase family protein [Reyranellaceae bacterium]
MIPGLTEEQRLLAESAERALGGDKGALLRQKTIADPHRCPPELWKQLADLGWLGIGIDPDHGGVGGGPLETMLVMNCLGRALVPVPFLSSVVIGSQMIGRLGNAQQRGLLHALAAGEHRVALAASEPTARYDLNDVQTAARADGNGFRLDGRKSVVLDGGAADSIIVLARTAGGRTDSAGLSLFLVPNRLPGMAVTPYFTYDGRAAAQIDFRNVHVDGSMLLGPRDGALPSLEDAIDRAIAAICAEAVGAMRGAYETTSDYLRTRKQFGRPIGSFQVMQHRLVDMYVMMEEALSLALAATLSLQDSGTARRRLIAAAKVQIGRAGKAIAQDCVQMHGGIGMTDEYIASHYFKSLLAIDTLFGDADHHLGLFPVDRIAS